jgi:hypothetical protein
MSRSRRRSIRALGGIVAVCCAVGAVAMTAQAGQGPPLWAGPAGGIVPLREPGGQGKPGGGGAKPAKLLTYHNGPVMTDSAGPIGGGVAVTAIYWGTSWGSPSFAGDKVSGLASFYGGIGGTSYMKTNQEYTQGDGAHVTTAVTNYAAAFDAKTKQPSTAPSTGAVLAVVANNIGAPVRNGYYPVYSDQKRGTAGYCAWHSYGTINGVPVQFAFFFNLDGDSGCDPGDTTSGHSQGLAALANVSGHELSETVTDPSLNAWYDSQGAENSDKCAWKFGTSPVSIGGSNWKIQGNWSNAAYAGGTTQYGLPLGCIQSS